MFQKHTGKKWSLTFIAILPFLILACVHDQQGEENPVAANPSSCSDGLDNDGDGAIDHPGDPGCESAADTDETDTVSASSFAQIQSLIFNRRCIVCHQQGTVFAEQSGLILTDSSAYDYLVNTPPTNQEAAQEGLLRVTPGDPDRSLLFHKLAMAVQGDSAYANRDYGQAMPLGADPLPGGHLEFIRQWILAGAPRDGQAANADLLLDTLPAKTAEFVPLEPPAPGEGFQLAVETFPISPQFEREFFIFLPIGNTEEIFVNRMTVKMRPGSHHFLLYLYDPRNPVAKQFEPEANVFRELRNLDGTLNIQNMTSLTDFAYVVGGTQIPEDDIQLPEGVGIRFPAGTHLDFNSHYVNTTDEVAYGQVAANLYTMPASAVKYEAFPIDLDNTGFKLPANQTTVVTTDFPVGRYIGKFGKTASDSMHIGSVFSHTHKLGKLFVVTAKGGAHDGDTLYVNDTWHHPPYKKFDTPLVLAPGDTLTSIVTYENTTDREVGFGFKSTEEMNIIFGFWY